MDITIYPQKLHGEIAAIPSKSQAHRLLICAAFSDQPTDLICPATNQDIEATAGCLQALGAKITRTENGYTVIPVSKLPETALLNCGESGSTLRFMLPIAGALGVKTTFLMAGRLPNRPLSPLWEEMERNGCKLSRPTHDTIFLEGKLEAGNYTISGSVSSQYITGLLYAMALLERPCHLEITGKVESKPYIDMTRQALSDFGIKTDGNAVSGSRPFHSPGRISVEGDWSNGAFFFAAKSLGNTLDISGLSNSSCQGDRACVDILKELKSKNAVIDAADIPDLVPILAVVAGAYHGAVFKNIARLRLKESDRVATVAAMINALGGSASYDDNTLIIYPGTYKSCTIDAASDHRIAMSAAIAATVSQGPVTIIGAQCVAKSYPSFWDEYKRLGGSYEQYIR